MKRTTVITYLCIPAILTVGGFAVALRREPFGLEMFAAYVLWGYLFYAAPYLLWVIVAALARFSNAMWHTGFIASSIALAAISSMWLFPRDPSGLPLQWMLYWPLAVVLQIVVACLTALYRRANKPNAGYKSDAIKRAP
jgi:cellulose synthase/poly-beta-1,6-N-acetylglucosamine synthase-like glycosyltransferase